MKKTAEASKTNLVPRILPRGRHKLDPQLVAASQRQRLIEAIVELVAERSYPDVTIGDIVARAGTAKRTFYDHFADKLQCFLAALDGITDTLVAASARFFAVSGTVRERCEYSMRGYLELLASMPNTAKVFYLEAVAAGPEAVTRRHGVQLKFAHNIVALSRSAAQGGEGEELSELHALAVVGALHQVIYGQLLEQGPDSLLGVIDDLVRIAVAFLTVHLPSARSNSASSRRKRTAR
ncbi:MAG: TetR/AcrR family transcriptional regulator [Deltaproteobacteria bacterium]|nr:MAG: TetR/AcrR family transcriptional regulator [Deltaproteobacteria bacterium]